MEKKPLVDLELADKEQKQELKLHESQIITLYSFLNFVSVQEKCSFLTNFYLLSKFDLFDMHVMELEKVLDKDKIPNFLRPSCKCLTNYYSRLLLWGGSYYIPYEILVDYYSLYNIDSNNVDIKKRQKNIKIKILNTIFLINIVTVNIKIKKINLNGLRIFKRLPKRN